MSSNDDLEKARKELYEQAGYAFGHTGQPLEAFLRELESFIDLKLKIKISDVTFEIAQEVVALMPKPVAEPRPVRKKLAEKPKIKPGHKSTTPSKKSRKW